MRYCIQKKSSDLLERLGTKTPRCKPAIVDFSFNVILDAHVDIDLKFGRCNFPHVNLSVSFGAAVIVGMPVKRGVATLTSSLRHLVAKQLHHDRNRLAKPSASLNLSEGLNLRAKTGEFRVGSAWQGDPSSNKVVDRNYCIL